MKISNQEIEDCVKSQKSLHLYPKMQEAFINVLGKLSEEDYKIATSNLIVMAMHINASGQVIHFTPSKTKFTVIQLNLPKTMSSVAMEAVIAHELGHVMQQRNWEESDCNSLEEDADKWAKKWGYTLTPEIFAELKRFRTLDNAVSQEF